jgi:hypothetical protein
MKRWWHNWLRLRGSKPSTRFYIRTLHEWIGGPKLCWITFCHTTGAVLWTPEIKKAEYVQKDEALGILKIRKDALLFTEGEWTLMLYKETFGHDWKPKL